MTMMSRVFARERPGAVPLPADRRVAAFTKADVLSRWGDEAAGLRPAALEQGDNVVTMFDIVGEDWWTGGGITAKKVAAQLRAIGDRPVEVQINSPGGDMFEGLAIYNVLREHSQQITVKVMGMAASAASIIAMAGDEIQIGAASFIMIHNCWVVAVGNRHDMAETAKWLEPFDTAMCDVYAARTARTAPEIARWMDEERLPIWSSTGWASASCAIRSRTSRSCTSTRPSASAVGSTTRSPCARSRSLRPDPFPGRLRSPRLIERAPPPFRSTGRRTPQSRPQASELRCRPLQISGVHFITDYNLLLV